MRFVVTQKEVEKRLDRFLQGKTSLSRKKVKSLLDQGRVTLNGRKVIIASWMTKKGDAVEILATGIERDPSAAKYFLKVIHEDLHLMVVEKEAGIPCEPSPVSTTPTMTEIINAYFKRRYPHLKGNYLAPVHRLDRETSGLMVYSRAKEANRLTEQFKQHTIGRKYLAIVAGPIETESGSIRGFLKKSNLLKGGQKVKSSTPESGKEAITHWNLIERYPNASLIEVTLNTGRTHQIRVQMASIGHPVVGDKLYGTSATNRFKRQALHASYLAFRHPVTGQPLEFTSQLPRDLRRLVDLLRKRA